MTKQSTLKAFAPGDIFLAALTCVIRMMITRVTAYSAVQ